MSNPECPECRRELRLADTFGNIDYCLNAINHPVGPWERERRPIKCGDIYRCDDCELSFHTLDDSDVSLREGYPC